MPITSVDDLCQAVESTLTTYLPDVMTALGFTTGAGYEPVRTWQQLPSVQALAAAELPAGAIVAPGLVTPPIYQADSDSWITVWRVPVGMYERGRNHSETQARIRNRIAAIRTTLLRHKSLGGVAKTLLWSGEEYDLIPGRESARTIAAGAVAFDITAEVDLGPDPAGALPVVNSVDHTLTTE
jgi:hypothetical protein